MAQPLAVLNGGFRARRRRGSPDVGYQVGDGHVHLVPDGRDHRDGAPDDRASHFWDAKKALPPLFASLLGLPEDWPAWDVYLAYPAGARWDDEPPAPAFWHHQLGDLDLAPKLDGEAFEKQLRELMAR